jgi:homospermidine synthase
LEQPGVSVRVRSWTPLAGAYHGFLITHSESISIADYLSVHQGSELIYRPTVHYAYHPCDDAVLSIDEFVGRDYVPQVSQRLLREEITAGTDELGVLLCGHPRGVYWYGSRLDVVEARRLAPRNNATTLQTAAGVLAGLVWVLENPERGVVEAEEMDFERAMAIARPYLGTLVGVWGDWTPLQGHRALFRESLDRDDPWQFGNVLVR